MTLRTLPSALLAIGALGASAQEARIQVIHNCADAAAAVVDVYVNGGATPFINDFAFRTATEFTSVPAGVDLEIGIAPGNSTGPQDIIPGLTFTYNLAANETYVIVANGIVSPLGYTPAPAFSLDVFAPGRESASNSANTDVLVLHGSTDAPTVQVAETAALGGAVIVPAFSYGDFSSDYLEVPTNNYVLEVQLPDGTPVVAYDAPLADLELDGGALVVLASGFLAPGNNSNGPAFGLWVALPSGGELLPLDVAQDPTARIQVIHNCADAAAAVVDVYVNGGATPFIDNFAFRTATEFTPVPAGVVLEIGIAPGNSAGPQDIIPGLTFTYNLADGETYVIVANGIVSPTGYSPAPAFSLDVFAPGRESASNSANTDVLVLHGSTDAPTVQVAETAVLGGAVIVPAFSYGDFSSDYLEVPTNNYVLEVQLPDGTPVVAYEAPLADLELDGAALVVLASGFLTPGNNSNGPGFGLWVALPSGGELIPLDLSTGLNEREQGSLNSSLFPNPAADNTTVVFNMEAGAVATIDITDNTGRVVRNRGSVNLVPGENRIVLPLEGLAEGMYQVNLTTATAARTLPLLISK